MLRIKQINVKGVRGIVDGPSLQFENGGLLLCGDNGTGKSSYVDSIEKVLSDRCSSLDHVGQSVSWSKQGSHLTSTESEITITLTDGYKDIVLNLDADLSTLDKQTRQFLEAAQQHSFVLRRRTLLDFIDAKPSDRYKSIEDFLKLDGFVSFETRLKELDKSVSANIRAATDAKEEHENTLRKIFGLATTIQIDKILSVKVVNDALLEAQLPTVTTLDSISSKIDEVEKLVSSVEDIELLKKIQALSDLVNRFPKDNTLVSKFQSYAHRRKELLDEEEIANRHFYDKVLKDGLDWIKEDGLKQCPLCNNPIVLSDVALHVASCLQSNKKIIEFRLNQSNSQKEFLEMLRSYKMSLDQIAESWKGSIGDKFPAGAAQSRNLIEEFLISHKNLLTLSQIDNDIVRLVEIDLDKQINLVQSIAANKLGTVPGSDKYLKCYAAKSKLSAVSLHFINGSQKAFEEIQTLMISKNQLGITVSLAEQARKNAVQKLLDEVVKIADGYFQRIHKGEGIGGPRLTVPTRGAGSIELRSIFHGEAGDPRGHYSEGHVDSLGLCLFLAIRRMQCIQRPELSLLILDDVMHSVDARHRLETANLIIDEFSDHQIIITTHDPLWFEYLKSATRKSKNNFVHKRISDWTIESGPVLGDHLSNYEWLMSENGKKAKPADKVIKVGLLLEEMLQNLCNNLSIPMPYRIRGDYTIDPLWNGFYSTAKKHKGFYVVAEPHLKTIDDLKSLRNWVGAHWNEWAQGLTNSEATSLVQAILEIRDIAYCDNCGQFINRISELDGVWSCKGEHKRYNKTI